MLRPLLRLRDSLQRAGEDEARPLTEHLEDLRLTLLRMGAVLLLGMVLCFAFTPQVLDFLRRPVERALMLRAQESLPNDLSAAEWEQARALAEQQGRLPQGAYAALLAEHPSPVQKAAGALPFLRAAAMLPPGEQADWLRRHCPAELLELSLALHRSGADLRPPPAQRGMQLMGAFHPGEAFMLSLSLAFYGGLVLSFPLLLLLALHFLLPGLRGGERRLLCRCAAASLGLFLAGGTFGYAIVLPRILCFFAGYAEGLGIANDWRIGYYLTFAAKLIFLFGAAFQLPVVVLPLIRLGLLPHERICRLRAHAFIGCLAAALALAPTPDPATMLLMALPMYLLFELCILYARFTRRHRV
ncbi:MAG: twin-arginine translocase subunit TatC [Akkermansia muciniphila]